MVQKLDTLVETPSQTAGPYVHIGLTPTCAGNAGYREERKGTRPNANHANKSVMPILA